MSKTALILGVGGQDGSYLAELLLAKGYAVHGLHRHTSTGNLRRIERILPTITLHRGDVLDAGCLNRLVDDIQPDEVYNMADQDNVAWSFAAPDYQWEVTHTAVNSLLWAVNNYAPNARVFQPCSATMFGDAPPMQDESTPLDPKSPYAKAKAEALKTCQWHRFFEHSWVSCGIMFNHDSPRRSEDYLLSKIAGAAVRIARGQQEMLELGNLDARVDIGFAAEYAWAAWRMLQQDRPDDYVIATGKPYTIRHLAAEALVMAGVALSSRVRQVDYPASPEYIGDASKARAALGWEPVFDALALVKQLVAEKEYTL